MFTNDELGVINISNFTKEQLKHFEESHKKWIESTRNIPIQFYDEKYQDEETNSPNLFDKDRLVIMGEGDTGF